MLRTTGLSQEPPRHSSMGKLAAVGVITGHIGGQAEDMLGEVVGRGSVNSGPEPGVLAWHSLCGQDAEN